MWDPFRATSSAGGCSTTKWKNSHRTTAWRRTANTLSHGMSAVRIMKEVESGREAHRMAAYTLASSTAPSRFARRLRSSDRSARRNKITARPRCRSRWRHCPIITWAALRPMHRCRRNCQALFAAGEVVGGANGANRLSGNAITEALVLGRRAGRSAAQFAKRMRAQPAEADIVYLALDIVLATAPGAILTLPRRCRRFRPRCRTMSAHCETLGRSFCALKIIDRLTGELGDAPFGDGGRFDMQRVIGLTCAICCWWPAPSSKPRSAAGRRVVRTSVTITPHRRRSGRSINTSGYAMAASYCRGRRQRRRSLHERNCNSQDLARPRC